MQITLKIGIWCWVGSKNHIVESHIFSWRQRESTKFWDILKYLKTFGFRPLTYKRPVKKVDQKNPNPWLLLMWEYWIMVFWAQWSKVLPESSRLSSSQNSSLRKKFRISKSLRQCILTNVQFQIVSQTWILTGAQSWWLGKYFGTLSPENHDSVLSHEK